MVLTFLKINKIEKVTENDFIKCVFYTINKINLDKSKNNFNNIFEIEYDIYYFTPKNLTILFVNLLDRKLKN